MAEGWTQDYSINIAANKQRVKDTLKTCCHEMGYEILERKMVHDKKDETNQWIIYGKQLSNYMRQFSVGAVNKSLPQWCFDLNIE
jgi:hypothetical protein